MLLSELIETLQGIADEYPDADPDVRLAMQPQWAFEYSIHSVTPVSLEEDDRGEDPPVVYLSEGAQLGYLPGAAKEAVW